ncbi:MAG: heme biosynthesis protein HemY [Mesorhizobium sp.]|nr:heme biosynthesis protein HemY [Mesorhizobium sp.]MBL8576639.1 heme biosynthesis protein HemY [Mesorhizobium sp.]
MIRILIFLAVVFALGLGFAWLADRPGDMVVTFGGYQYQVSLMVAAVAVTAIVAAVMITWWLVKSIWNSPYTIARYFRVRQRDRGYQALSTGMIAAGAGDATLARKMNKQAAKLIRSETEPLINLLDAQASLLEGDHKSAREKFERMLDDPEMRLLGLRGLYLEAERLGDRSAARHYAGRAADVAPQLGWALDSTLEEKTAAGDWDGALKLVDAQKSAGGIEKDVVNRKRAVLLTAKAEDLLDTDLASAKAAAVEANRLAPNFAPAAVVAAKALFRQNDVRKGSKILEAAWKAEPHPSVADLYTHARPGDAVLDRLARARKLEQLRSNNVESSLAVARAALDAHEFKLAREAAEAAVRMQPREGAYLLLADVEEAETGDQGRVRQFLARAVRAQRDPAWVADGFVSERWAPVSPVTGKLDAFEWRVPVERLGPLIEQDVPEHPSLALPSAVEPDDVEAAIVHEVDTTVAGPVEIVEEKAEAKPQAPEDLPDAKVASEAVNASDPVEPVRLPDDPGVDPGQEQEKSERRFRLF